MHKFTLGGCILLLIGFLWIGAEYGVWAPFLVNLVLLVIQLIPRIVSAVKENKEQSEIHNNYIENGYKTSRELFEEDLSVGLGVDEQEEDEFGIEETPTVDKNQLSKENGDKFSEEVFIHYKDIEKLLYCTDVILSFCDRR